MELSLDKIKVKTAEDKPCRITFAVTIPADIVKTQKVSVTDEFQKHSRLPGFRPGKAPRPVVEQSYADKITGEAIDHLMRDAVSLIIREKHVHPVTHPAVDKFKYEEGSALSFEVIIERNPEYKVRDYNKIPVKKKTVKVDEALVNKELEQLQERAAKLAPSESLKAEKKHCVVIDYAGYVKGAIQSELIDENQLIDLAAPQFMEGFADGILGMAKGEVKDVPVKFPKDHPKKELAGQDVVFKVTLHDIKEKQVPKLDDEFAKDLGVESLADLKGKIESSLKISTERNLQSEVERQIFDHLIEENPIPLPDSLVKAQLEYLVERSISQMRVHPDKLEEARKTLSEKYRSNAERQVRISYIVTGIAKQEELKATLEEVRAEMDKAIAATPAQKERIQSYFEENQPSILDQITSDKVMKYLTEHAKIKEVTE